MSQCLSHSSLRTQQCPGRSLNVSIVSKAIPASDNVRAEVSMSQCLKAIPAVPASEPNYARAEVSMSQCLKAIPASELRSLTMPRDPGRSLNVSMSQSHPSLRAWSPTIRELCPGRSLNVSTSQSHPSLRALPNQYSGFGASRAQLCLASPTMPREPNYASRVQLCLASPTMPPEPNYAFRAELCLRRTVCKHFAAPQIPRPTTLSPQNRQPFETHDSRACVETSPVANTE